MEEYPKAEANKLKFKVLPWCRETMKSQCDLAFHTDKLNQEYPDLDTSLVQGKFWFLDFYVPLHEATVQHVDLIRQKMAEKDSNEEKLQSIVDYMKSVSPTRIENEQQAHLRVLRAKEQLASELRQIEAETGKDIQDFNIVLVAHSNFLRNFTGEGLGKDLKPINCHRFMNGEIFEYNFKY